MPCSHTTSMQTPISRRRALALGAAALGSASLAALGTGCANQDEKSGSAAGSTSAGSAALSADAAGTTLRIGALKGPTGMGLVGLMAAADFVDTAAIDQEDGASLPADPAGIGKLANTYEFTLAGSADEFTPALIQGELDVLCVPANLAAVLYQKTEGAVQVLGVNTLGVLDIVTVDTPVSSIADLAGCHLVSAGRGSTPQYALEYLLRANGVDPATDLTIEWKSEHAECLAALQADPTLVAMLPQPFATSALAKLEGATLALDLTDVWNETVQREGGDSQLITGVAVARTAFVEEHPDAVDELVEAYARSVDYVNDDAAGAAQLIEAAGIIDAAVAERALPYCHIVWDTGAAMQNELAGYLETLYDADPASVGGTLPDDAFYYEG